MVATAIIGSAVVGAVATTSAANSASKAETTAANNATNVEEGQYNQTRSDLMPYQQTGQAALPTYNSLLGLGSGSDSTTAQNTLTQTPGYQFTLSQGLKAAQNSAAARGLGVSGAAYKGAANYAGGLADTTYQNEVGDYLSASQLGENAAAQTGSYGTQTAATVGNNITSAGNASAASSVASGNAISGIGSSISNALIYNSLLNGGAGMYGSGATTTMPAALSY